MGGTSTGNEFSSCHFSKMGNHREASVIGLNNSNEDDLGWYLRMTVFQIVALKYI
jgi:hypothetical protein